MRKWIFLIVLFIGLVAEAQDSLAVAENRKIIFTEKDIQVDNDSIAKVTFSKNFKKKYTDDAFVYEEKTKEKNAWDRFKEWLGNIMQNIFNFSSKHTSAIVVVFILRLVAILVVGFVIYLIAKAILNKEGQWVFGKNLNKKVIYDTDIEKQLFVTDFEKLIKETLDSDQNRLSIRYYYLWLLKIMSEKNRIKWDIEKTNSDYLYEIKNETEKENFAYLFYLYNYIWYGEFDLDQTTFEKAKNAFEKTIRSL
jgi:hypothetical protein